MLYNYYSQTIWSFHIMISWCMSSSPWCFLGLALRALGIWRIRNILERKMNWLLRTVLSTLEQMRRTFVWETVKQQGARRECLKWYQHFDFCLAICLLSLRQWVLCVALPRGWDRERRLLSQPSKHHCLTHQARVPPQPRTMSCGSWEIWLWYPCTSLVCPNSLVFS